ncbi:hypothetical protein [uncultured Kordia sp.]|uniref:hypothetical protein n=1 Tax=uncultured Kordia sp. TaxID=507699 RepID=UPI0026305F5F|nr:hypothetical protein [uncultured Kordia sp.]
MLKEVLPAYMIPAVFVEINDFPLTPNKKKDAKYQTPFQLGTDLLINASLFKLEAKVRVDFLKSRQLRHKN